MIGISDFFKRIKGAHMREILVRTAAKDSLKKVTGIDVEIDSVSFSSGALIVKGMNSAARSAIFIKKAAIIEEVNRSQEFRKISDIR